MINQLAELKKKINFELDSIAEKSTEEFTDSLHFILHESSLLDDNNTPKFNYHKNLTKIKVAAKSLRLEVRQVQQAISLFRALDNLNNTLRHIENFETWGMRLIENNNRNR